VAAGAESGEARPWSPTCPAAAASGAAGCAPRGWCAGRRPPIPRPRPRGTGTSGTTSAGRGRGRRGRCPRGNSDSRPRYPSRAPHGRHPGPLTRPRIRRERPPNSTPPSEGAASRGEGCRRGAAWPPGGSFFACHWPPTHPQSQSTALLSALSKRADGDRERALS
jgi:hypothetical protein